MKKVMFAAAVAAGLVAIGEGIESANVVGYNTVTINKQYTILGIPFTGTTGAAMSIQDAIPYSEGMTKGAGVTASDNIQIMDSEGNYETYFMCNGLKGKATVSGGDGKWVKGDESVVSTKTMPAGTPFWYVSKNYATPYTITVAGQVLSTDSSQTPLNVTYQLIANPYPCDLPLNNGIPYVEGMTKGAGVTAADNIQIMDNEGGYATYFMCNGLKGKAAVSGGDGKWVRGDETAVSTDVLPAGKGAWFVRKSASLLNITIANPNAAQE